MFSRIPRRPVFLCLALALALAVALGTFGVGVAQEKETKTGPNEKIDQLLRERCSVLGRLCELLVRSYHAGMVDFKQVLDAQKMRLDAELACCKTKEERIRVYGMMLDLAKNTLSITKARVKSGTAHEADELMAQAQLLTIRIELEREKTAE